MNKQNQQRINTLLITTGAIILVAMLLYLIPRAQNFGSISSDEVDDLLYERLASYELALQSDPVLAGIIRKALTAPDTLDDEDRDLYVSYERRFFSGWEIAWEHHSAGYFEPQRFNVWDAWYVEETHRRPIYAWLENKSEFSASFVRHVEEALDIQMAENAFIQ